MPERNCDAIDSLTGRHTPRRPGRHTLDTRRAATALGPASPRSTCGVAYGFILGRTVEYRAVRCNTSV